MTTINPNPTTPSTDGQSEAAACRDTVLPPSLLSAWVDANRHLLQPPVGNRYLYDGKDFFVMIIGGPNARNDYHLTDSEEFFMQIKGDIVVTVIENGVPRHVPIREGETFFVPGGVPHSPQRPPDTIGLVVERRRPAGETEHLPVLLPELRPPRLRRGVRLRRHRRALQAGDGGVLGGREEIHLQRVRVPHHEGNADQADRLRAGDRDRAVRAEVQPQRHGDTEVEQRAERGRGVGCQASECVTPLRCGPLPLSV